MFRLLILIFIYTNRIFQTDVSFAKEEILPSPFFEDDFKSQQKIALTFYVDGNVAGNAKIEKMAASSLRSEFPPEMLHDPVYRFR